MNLQVNENALIKAKEIFKIKISKYPTDALDEILTNMLYQESLIEAAAACCINQI